MTSQIDTYDLRKRAILIRINTKVFGTQKKHAEATEKAARDHNASTEQVFVGTNILNRKNPLFKKIDKIKGLIRNTHISMSGPWMDDGYRVITTKRYAQWRQVMEDLVSQFDEAVDDFVKAYADLQAEAKINLGNLYDADNYPPADEIRASFSVTLETEVLPDRGNNVILELDKARTDKIMADATATDQKRVKELTEHTHQIVRGELEGMIKALGEFGDAMDDTKRTRTFRDSLVKRMAGLADTLPGLNVTGDVRLDKLAQDIAGKLTTIDAAALRGDKVKGDNRTEAVREADAASKREEVKSDAADLLDDLNSVFGTAADVAARPEVRDPNHYRDSVED